MGKRAQRIPSWPGVIHSNKGRIHLRRPTCDILTFRLRRSGGPYIPRVADNAGVTACAANPAWLMGKQYSTFTRKLVAKHRKTALRGFTSRFVLDHIPVLY